MKLTRRHVLAVLACTGAAALLGSGGVALRWWDRPAGAGRAALSEDEYDFVQALAEAWMPAGGRPELSGADADLGGYFDLVLTHAQARERKLFKLLLQALDDATIPTRTSSFRHLPLADRADALRGWLVSDVGPAREAVRGLLLLMSEGYGTHPDVIAEMKTLFPCGVGGAK